jgi:hypothetical protein
MEVYLRPINGSSPSDLGIMNQFIKRLPKSTCEMLLKASLGSGRNYL